MAMAPRATLLLAVSLLAMAAAASAHGAYETCTSDILHGLDFTKCVNVLGIKHTVNQPYDQDCCPLIKNIFDIDAGLCLCKKLNPLGLVDVTLQIRIILNNCRKYCPSDFKCPPAY